MKVLSHFLLLGACLLSALSYSSTETETLLPSSISSPISMKTPSPLNLHHFDTERFPLALCNDGTVSGFYYAPSTTGSKTWIIQQQGGAWCYDERTCKARPSALVSSKNWSPTLTRKGGIFNSSDTRLRDAHKIYVPYCTSDGYIGNAPTNSFGFQFRGRAVVDALFSTLKEDYGMGTVANTSILYSGCSAGARGALFNADHVAQMFVQGNSNISRYGVLLDSAFWVDLDPVVSGVLPFSEQAKKVFDIARVNTTADPVCLRYYRNGEEWKCIFAQYAVNLVRSSFLLHAYLYDAFQLPYDLHLPAGSWPKSPQQLAFAEYFRNVTSKFAHEDVHAPQQALLPACYAHCGTEDDRWRNVQAQGISLDKAVSSWFWEEGDVPDFIEDLCSGFNCGKGCPSHTENVL